MGDLNITGWPSLDISSVKGIEPIRIKEVQNISPVAHHVKEVNHIDPLNIDAFHVSEVRNIDPITVDRFQVTNLPPVNVTLRQLPQLDMNVRTLPAVSIGSHQDFSVPSNYTIHGQFLGFELFRLFVTGGTTIAPRDKYCKEQELTHNRSFPVPAVKGNEAIPKKHAEEVSSTCSRSYPVRRASHVALRIGR